MSEPTKPAGDKRWATIYEAMTGATAPGDHDHGPIGTDAESAKAGHEPDRFDAKGIIAVPILIIGVCVVTYGIITATFSYLDPMTPTTDSATNTQSAADQAKPFNERATKISSSDDHAAVKQPRLEFVRAVNTKDGEAPNYRSFRPTGSANAPEITPQFLRPENFIDWNTGEKKLVDYKWLNKDKGIVRIPIAEAMEILSHDKKLPAKADGTVAVGTGGKPKLSNGGQASPPPELPKAEKKPDDHKH